MEWEFIAKKTNRYEHTIYDKKDFIKTSPNIEEWYIKQHDEIYEY